MIRITTTRYANTETLVVQVGGNAESASADDMQIWLSAHARTRPASVVLDLIGLSGISGCAVRSLVRFISTIHTFGGEVALVARAADVRAALAMVRIEQLATIESTLDRAAANVSHRRLAA